MYTKPHHPNINFFNSPPHLHLSKPKNPSNLESIPSKNHSLPSISQKPILGPIKVKIDFKKEYEEDQELISLLDPQTYKQKQNKPNTCEIIPEEDEDLHKNIFNSNSHSKRILLKRINIKNKSPNTIHHPLHKQHLFPLLTCNNSPKRIIQHNILTQSTPLPGGSLLTTPNNRNVDSSSTSGFTHDTHDERKQNVKGKKCYLPITKPLSQQKQRYNVNIGALPKPRRGFSSTYHEKNTNMNNRKVHRIKIEVGMMGTKLMDKLVNTMKYDLSTGTFKEEFGF